MQPKAMTLFTLERLSTPNTSFFTPLTIYLYESLRACWEAILTLSLYYTRFVCKEGLINLVKSTAGWQLLTGIPIFEKVEKIRCFIYKISLFPSMFSDIIECSIPDVILYGSHFFTGMQIQLCRLTVCGKLLMSCINSGEIFFLCRFRRGGFVGSFIGDAGEVLNERCNDATFLLIDCWCGIVIFFAFFLNWAAFFIFFFARSFV